jgi:hypothetical protein
MPREHQRRGWGLRTAAGRTGKPFSGGKGGGAQNRFKRWQRQIDGVRDRLLQDQLLTQCEETLPAKMVRVLQGARLVSGHAINNHRNLLCALCRREFGGEYA